ncbi:MAG TPA: FtsK/SpoIIIE domain-containing protein, partial [Chthoniobacteraceae bacterium]
MSSGTDLRVARSLELLRELTRTSAEFAAREEELTRDIRTRRQTGSRRYRDALDKLKTTSSGQLAATQHAFDAEAERVRGIYDARQDRVQRLRLSGLRNLPRRAQEAKGKWMGDLQLRKFRAEKTQTADLRAAGEAFKAFTAHLGQQSAALVALQTRARRAFRGYGAFARLLQQPSSDLELNLRDPEKLSAEANAHLVSADEQLIAFKQHAVARAFSEVPLVVVAGIVVLLGAALAVVLGMSPTSYAVAGGAIVLLLSLLFVLHAMGRQKAAPAAASIATTLAAAAQTLEGCKLASEARYEEERQRITTEFETTVMNVESQWDQADDVETDFAHSVRSKIEVQAPRVLAAIEKNAPPKLERIASERITRMAALEADAAEREEQITEAYEAEIEELNVEEKTRWTALEQDWQTAIQPLYQTIGSMNAALAATAPVWSTESVESWAPQTAFTPAARFANLSVNLTSGPNAAPKDPRLHSPGPAEVSIPLALNFPERGSLLFETHHSASEAVIDSLNNIILRLLASTPPGKLSFTIIDPIGLGQSFAGLMHLSDYEESLINRRIWTQRDQIEDRLAELSEHIEKVIQMYLRNEYATITEYNEKAGSVAEKYHFLVVADFPTNFSEVAARRLQSIAASGPRCGIFTLIHWDQRQTLPDGFSPEQLRQNSITVRRENDAFVIAPEQVSTGATLRLETPPEPELAVSLIHKIGKASIDANRVEVPFQQIAPAPDAMWTHDTTGELRVAIGRTGATKHQYLAIGKGTRQHALFAGKTGSGKSTLFHVIITNLALACSPE